MMNYYFPLNTKIETTEFVFYLKVIPWLIGYWISTTTKEGFLFAGQKFRFDWCSWNFFCPSTQNGNVWDIRDKIYLWIIFFWEPQTKDISPAETKKISKWILGYHQKKTELKGITLSGLFQRLIYGNLLWWYFSQERDDFSSKSLSQSYILLKALGILCPTLAAPQKWTEI